MKSKYLRVFLLFRCRETIHANVPVGNAKEPEFIMLKKFDGTRAKFRGFVQHVNFFLWFHPSRYPNDSTQVAFIGSLLSRNAFSWFEPFLEKHSPVLQDITQSGLVKCWPARPLWPIDLHTRPTRKYLSVFKHIRVYLRYF
jgi:hypothetical protein